jgi:hypothetical protein
VLLCGATFLFYFWLKLILSIRIIKQQRGINEKNN